MIIELEAKTVSNLAKIPKTEWVKFCDGYRFETLRFEFVLNYTGNNFMGLTIRPKGSSDSSKDIDIRSSPQALKNLAWDIHSYHQDKIEEDRLKFFSRVNNDLSDRLKFVK